MQSPSAARYPSDESVPHRKLWPVSARILRLLSRDVDAPDYPGGTDWQIGDRALEFVLKTVPGFIDMIRGKSVLDYGCGRGNQVLAMKSAGASYVVGYDPHWKFPAQIPVGVKFTTSVPSYKFDVVLSCSSFEHFADPEREFRVMQGLARERLIITWAEPWYSHAGAHVGNFTRVPWVNLLFPERSVMLVRALYRDDRAKRYEEFGDGGGVNRMTVARFERIIAASGMRREFYRNYATRGLPLVTRLPVLRELLTSACTCILSTQE